MKLMARFAYVGSMALVLAVLAACGSTNPQTGGASALDVGANGENLAFDKATLSASANQQVTVNFKNPSTANQHNWVLVKGGDDVASKVDEEATSASDTGYIPTDPNILTSVKTLDPGGNGTASFTAPAGTYTYICTIPGHYAAGMKGTLTVQ